MKLALANENMSGITVGTTETFQGQERTVIIISTMRTDNRLGFVADRRVRNLS